MFSQLLSLNNTRKSSISSSALVRIDLEMPKLAPCLMILRQLVQAHTTPTLISSWLLTVKERVARLHSWAQDPRMSLALTNLNLDPKTTLRRDKAELLSRPLLLRTGTLPWVPSDQLREGSWLVRLTSIAKIPHKECLALAVTPLKSGDARR